MKLNELHQTRQRANEEIKTASVELSKQQGEINVLILETRKYEGQLSFLTAERDMILAAQMQAQATALTPEMHASSLVQAQNKKEKLEEQLT